MITQVKIKDYGPFDSLEWKPGTVNLILAENGRGKTFLLKALYTAVKALETYGRGHQSKSFPEVLSEKLEWTFQTKNGIGACPTRVSSVPLYNCMKKSSYHEL